MTTLERSAIELAEPPRVLQRPARPPSAASAYGVSVYPNPADPEVARCIALAIRKLVWPSTAHRDFFSTTY